MKKMFLMLCVLLLASAYAQDIDIYCAETATDGEVAVMYTAYGDAGKARGLGLEITLDTATITAVTKVTDNKYWVYPGSINTDDANEYNGTPVASGGVGSSSMIIEMGSLHSPTGASDSNAPALTGTLIKFNVSGDCNVSIAGDATRGEVVLYDTTAADANYTGCQIFYNPDPWAGTCWSAIQCPGQSVGDATCDGRVNAVDLLRLKNSWLKKFGQAGYNCCANFDHSATGVNAVDLLRIKQHWLESGLGGDLTIACPSSE